jgi:hypothetical protein
MSEPFDASQVWAEIEDYLIPCVALRGFEPSLYYHLVRQTRMRGLRTVRTSHNMLAASTGNCTNSIREILRRLARKGCVCISPRDGRHAHGIEVLLPREIPACAELLLPPPVKRILAPQPHTPAMRRVILRRERGLCFYCRRRVHRDFATLDHIVPRKLHGDDSCWNLVACCPRCNRAKADRPAADFLRELHRLGRLSFQDLESQLAALEQLQRGWHAYARAAESSPQSHDVALNRRPSAKRGQVAQAYGLYDQRQASEKPRQSGS